MRREAREKADYGFARHPIIIGSGKEMSRMNETMLTIPASPISVGAVGRLPRADGHARAKRRWRHA